MEDRMSAYETKPEAKTPDLETIKRYFNEARDLTEEARKESQIDDDYFHGYQLTADERRILQDRRQPDTIFNRIRPAVLGTLGVIKQGATDPRAYPREPGDEDAADVVTKALQFAADRGKFKETKIAAALNFLKEGTCAAIVEIDGERNVAPNLIAWEEFFYDPRSRRADLHDARYMGIAKWRYADDVAADFPDAKVDVDAYISGTATSETFEDRPRDNAQLWVDARKKRVMQVEIYYREGSKWLRCVFYGGGILKAEESPYKDKKGRTLNPIKARSCFVDRDNNRYGIVRDMRGPQDEINKRRQKLLHLLNNRQLMVTEQGFDFDPDKARNEAARPDGVIPFGYQPVPTTDMTSGQFNLLAESKSEIERMGPSPSILGRQAADQSGRSALVRQQAGLTELAVVFGGIEAWELEVYEAMWERIQQFWTAPMYIRVTNDQKAPEFIGINQPVQGPPQVGMDPATGMPAIIPTVLGYKNAVAEMDVDIMLDSVPDTANLAQEQFQTIADLMAKTGQPVPLEIMIELSTLPEKHKIIEKLKQAGANPMQEQQAQIAMEGAVADIEKTKSETARNMAIAQKSAVDAQMGAFQAGFGAA